MVLSSMWQPEQGAIMCAALQGHAAAHSSSNRPSASLAMLHFGLQGGAGSSWRRSRTPLRCVY